MINNNQQVFECLPCQMMFSKAEYIREFDGTNKLEFSCPNDIGHFTVYYQDGRAMSQPFIEDVVRSALSLCARCKELKRHLDNEDNVI